MQVRNLEAEMRRRLSEAGLWPEAARVIVVTRHARHMSLPCFIVNASVHIYCTSIHLNVSTLCVLRQPILQPVGAAEAALVVHSACPRQALQP